jgi:hypothetical protein
MAIQKTIIGNKRANDVQIRRHFKELDKVVKNMKKREMKEEDIVLLRRKFGIKQYNDKSKQKKLEEVV